MTPARTVRLAFRDLPVIDGKPVPVHRDISAIVREGDTLFLACDEGAGIERLLRDGDGFGHHRHIRLGDLLDLPAGPEGEMDIEGLAIDGGWLWVLGSQSLKRDKVKAHAPGPEALDDLADIDWDGNRQFLGRLPLVTRHGGLWPVAQDGDRRAAHLRFKGKGRLRRWLRKDRHLAAFLDLPSKENGLDAEGIVARGDRVWVGLRGPVLGESAVVLEMEMRVTGKGHLKARRIEGRSRLRKHFVDTDGQGIRDMKWDGDDLLLVTGPVLSGNGPAAILRLHGFAGRDDEGYLGESGQTLLQRLPYRESTDHPEGLVQWDGPEWLVVCDSPAPERVGDDPPYVDGDVWRL
ncbi:DUF3616 domain-containing protein [Rubellimicrobium roseum]|nr:DUF3616 domain-containing protein [Rubellimicrobium roseum]